MKNNTECIERGNIEKIPDYPKKTPLQKAIQLLKRHRDVMFLNDRDNAPASIIITTIAARIYHYETDILTIFDKILKNILNQIENRQGIYWVPNPVNPNENFADKWETDKNKQKAFFNWVEKIKTDSEHLIKSQTSDELLSCLHKMFGDRIVDQSNNNLGGYSAIVPVKLKEPPAIMPPDIVRALSVPHRKKAPWHLPLWNTVQIEATTMSDYSTRKISSGELLNKGLKLRFKAVHGVQSPYIVKWQITNTGFEAQHSNDLRGDFYNSDSDATNIRTEDTMFSGVHYIQCFIIKKGKCIAKSKEFIVRIK